MTSAGYQWAALQRFGVRLNGNSWRPRAIINKIVFLKTITDYWSFGTERSSARQKQMPTPDDG